MKILITGASSGIGYATAELLLSQGHELLLGARRVESFAKLAEKWPKLRWTKLDLTDSESIKNFVTQNEAWLKDIDVLVNNAGLALGREGYQDYSLSDLHTMMATNVTGLLEFTRLILPSMIARKKGHILNLGSVAGDTAYPGGTVYCATKAAVHMITDCLRLDLGGKNIRVSTVAPGRVAETEFSEVRFKGDREAAKKVYEGFRPLSAKDVAETISWVLLQPEHINIQQVVLMSVDQVNATTVVPFKG